MYPRNNKVVVLSLPVHVRLPKTQLPLPDSGLHQLTKPLFPLATQPQLQPSRHEKLAQFGKVLLSVFGGAKRTFRG